MLLSLVDSLIADQTLRNISSQVKPCTRIPNELIRSFKMGICGWYGKSECLRSHSVAFPRMLVIERTSKDVCLAPLTCLLAFAMCGH